MRHWLTKVYRLPKALRENPGDMGLAGSMPLGNINLYEREKVSKTVKAETAIEAVRIVAEDGPYYDGDIIKVDMRCWMCVQDDDGTRWDLVEWTS